MVNDLAVTNSTVLIVEEINPDVKICKNELNKPVGSIASSETTQTNQQKQQDLTNTSQTSS